jgi:cytochrome c peroxidase
MKKRNLLLLLCIVAALLSCRKEPDHSDTLDRQLTELLERNSEGNGLEYFILPGSDEYEKIPQDPKNPITGEKVELGKLLFHETKLAINPKFEVGRNTYSCATCHHAPGGFQACRAQGLADGGIGFGLHGEARYVHDDYPFDSLDVQPLRTPSILNCAYQEVLLWNGQFGATGMNAGTEASWTAGTPKEHNHLGYQGAEIQSIAGMNVHRMGIDPDFIKNSGYKELFDIAFSAIPEGERYNLINAALAIAAYERSVLANKAPFQKWLRGNFNAMNTPQKEGAILFFGKGKCASCHTGPALNSMAFHALGMDDLDLPGVYGNGPSDGDKKGRGGFTNNPEDDYKFKVPQLYSLRYSPFYGHGSSFNSIRDVVAYKNKAVKQNMDVPDEKLDPAFKPLGLTDREVDLITDFLEYALADAHLHRYEPQFLPSGNCFPNNDPLSRTDLGCDTRVASK